MDRNKILLIILLFFTYCFTLNAQAENFATQSPIGYWKIMDDVTGKPKSIVQIWKDENNILMGKVIKVFADNNDVNNTVCTACSGKNHNQPILGMVILSGLKEHRSQWNAGTMIDPTNGKTYECSAKLADNGEKLKVLGYVGIPLFGRSQTWERVDLLSGG